MPIQSRLLPLDSYTGLDVVPFVAADQVVALQYILENSPLNMTLWDHHLHHASATEDLFSIDFELANALWFILKDLSRTIQLTADPLLNPFGDLSGTLNSKIARGHWYAFPHHPCYWKLHSEPSNRDEYLVLWISPKIVGKMGIKCM